MADQRLTRWQKAKADSHGFKPGRDAIGGVVGGVVAALVLLGLGFPKEGLIDVIVVVVSAAAATVLVPLGELSWNWLQAPMRQLTVEVVAIRKALEATPSQTPISLPRAINNYVRRGRTLLMMPQFSEQDASDWANEIGSILDKHGDYEDAARFSLAQGEGGVHGTLKVQIAVLAEIGGRLEKHWGKSVRKEG